MNLSDYAKMPKADRADFLKWTANGEIKVIRILYDSRDGSDIPVIFKHWDDAQKKYVVGDTVNGKLTCVLDCVLYGTVVNGVFQPLPEGPKLVKWERSAAFAENACNGYWSKFPRIKDGVWEVTCTNPGTKDIKFSWFPVQGADIMTHPIPEAPTPTQTPTSATAGVAPDTPFTPDAPTPQKTTKYWD